MRCDMYGNPLDDQQAHRWMEVHGMLGRLNNKDIVQTCQGRDPSSVVTVLVHKDLERGRTTITE